MKVTVNSRLQFRIQYILFVILLLSCISFAGWLSNEYNLRSDWTAGKRHSLSNDTIQLLNQLPSTVNLRSYQPDDPALTQAVTEILNRYKNNKSDFNFQLLNPDIFLEQAKADNIESYGQTIIEYQGRTERINSLSEESVTNALMRLQRSNKPELMFVSQHGERDTSNTSAVGYSQLATNLTSKGYKVRNINLLQDSITIDNTVLIISSINKSLLESEQNKILNFIKAGGNLLWLQDPGLDPSQQNFANELNIEFIDGVIVDNNQEVSRMLKLSHPAIIPVLEYKLHPITEKMQYFTLFTTASAIHRKSIDENWLYSELLISSDSSWSESDNFILGVEFNKEKDLAGPLSIGIAQQRQITSNTKNNTQNINQKIVIIGDTDFLANNNLVHGANLDFIIKSFNWLTEDSKQISIAAKNAPDLKLNLSANQASIIGLVFLIALPAFFFLFAAYIWNKRRKQ